MARRRARWKLVVFALAALLLAVGLWRVGHIVVHVDPLQHADAIYVLGGSRVERALEARDLYKAGWAPRIVISQGGRENAEVFLESQGIHVETEGEVARDALVDRLGVPASAVTVLDAPVDNTAQESAVIRPHVLQNHWTSLIAVCDCASTRRVGFALRRALPPGITVIVRCSRHDGYDPDRWWSSRARIRETYYELPKLLMYWMGLKG